MSLETILGAIEAAGDAEAARLQAETAERVRQILAEAERTAAARRDERRRAAMFPAAGERARRLHHARLEALRLVGQARDRLVESALTETRRRLENLRACSDYPPILRRLVEEAVGVMGDEIVEGHVFRLEADPRDEPLLRRILSDLGLDAPLDFGLECWGGVIAHSHDGRIVATNTLEARLERALPFLRRDLAAVLERETAEAEELQEAVEAAVL